MNFITGEDFNEKIKNLKFSNTYHILWIYKNIKEVYDKGSLENILDQLIKITIDDFNCALSIYDDLCNLVLKAYKKDKYIDDEDIFHIKNKDEDINIPKYISDNEIFFKLCIPIMDTCLKQIVDLFTYIFKIEKDFTNLNKLIERYNTKKDILIELLILQIKLSENEDIDFLLQNINLKKEDKNIDLKSLLLDFELTNLNFFIENVCIFLTYRNDSFLLSRLINYCKSGYKHFIIKNITVPLYKKIKDHLEICEDLLKKGIYDYSYFLNWCNRSFTNLSLLKINDFVEISRIFIEYFKREDNKCELYKILENILNLKIHHVYEDIRINILNYIDIIYKKEYTFLNDLLLEASKNRNLRNILITKLIVLKNIDSECKTEIINNLFCNFDFNWRYRKALLNECVKNIDLLEFKNEKWLIQFEKDKIYVIRELAKKIKKQLYKKEEILCKKPLENDKQVVDKTEKVTNASNVPQINKQNETHKEIVKSVDHKEIAVDHKVIVQSVDKDNFTKINVKNRIKNIEEKIVFINEKNNKK
ncbi:hypothetical protein AAJ76_3000033094 [Vairimorpha ceranae]|uniref:Uncharacterized protein n=1 Tax=Vairimorpha ceranae TaxID=40302 RepID=A0A0F9WED8_9MICR|nr:hypothetical protein AAJ76_3000033094 [Vairimorpha ceranae]KKO75160.1 hypothetical protein AAJ76_3000033094 [Vairimorpha ceranae]